MARDDDQPAGARGRRGGHDVVRRRLSGHRLAGNPLGSPADVVRWLGAVQAQDYPAALWAIGARLRGVTEAAVERAVEERAIVRTWPMRRTLHFVPAADARWMLDLLAARSLGGAAARYRFFELDAAVLRRCRELLERALAGGRRLTRQAAYAVLEEHGIATGGSRGLHVLAHLAQEGVLCCGPREGRQPTFVLLAEWVPRPALPSREEALAELARRYLRGHGPASERDLAWWSGLPVTVARRAIAALGSIVERVAADGGDLWAIAAEPPARGGGTHLLPAFDEYTVAYRDRRAVLAPEHASRVNAGGGILHPVIVSAGRVVGTWRRQARRGGVAVQLAPFAPLPPARRAAVAAAAKRYGAFVGLPVVVE